MYVPTVKLKGLPKHIKVAGMHALLYLSKVLCTKIDILLKAFDPSILMAAGCLLFACDYIFKHKYILQKLLLLHIGI